ncbi:MAG: type IV pilus modification protein PilV [Polaromonas sp.]|nr:type IV pilus modification protein PilV [Polaromonas sp.]
MQLRTTAKRWPRPTKRKGFMLIEVLVSIALSAVALLALASLNAAALRFTKMSQYRAVATQLASDIGERMRANKGRAAEGGAVAEGFWAGDYDYTTSFAGQAATVTAPAPRCNTALSVCSTRELANLDLAQWRFQARRLLPEGSVFVLRQASAVAADVWIAWRDPLIASRDEAPARANECPSGMAVSDLSVRCSYFRVNL